MSGSISHPFSSHLLLSFSFFSYPLGLSNIIGIIVYISANSGDPGQSDSKKSYSYGWSFYFGALSFIMAEMVGVLAVHMFIEKHRKLRAKSRTELIKKSAFSRIPSYRYRFRRRSSVRSSEAPSRDASPLGKGGYTGPAASEMPMYTLNPREAGNAGTKSGGGMGGLLNSEREFLQSSTLTKDYSKDPNRRTTPVWGSAGCRCIAQSKYQREGGCETQGECEWKQGTQGYWVGKGGLLNFDCELWTFSLRTVNPEPCESFSACSRVGFDGEVVPNSTLPHITVVIPVNPYIWRHIQFMLINWLPGFWNGI